ncbi:TIGR00730 family Rossman fold protein [Nonomuraea sp. NPDC049607]|uniref:LOG family protein n=1 Tax=unclassified Nonomuraea TaxID=2593643 RepID=UPI0034401A13
MTLRNLSAMPADEMSSGTAPRPLTICVFCGARPGLHAGDAETARRLGRLIGSRGHRLLYGGGGSGLMGELAWSAQRHGAPITGVIPTFLYERERGIAAPPQDTVLTTTMGERKSAFLTRADAFVALPGGFGTLDEVLEVISLNQLEVLAKPIVLVDSEGFWGRFVALVRDLAHRGFTEPGFGPHCSVTDSAEDALRCLETYLAEVAVPVAADVEGR